MIEFIQFLEERAKFDTTLQYHDKLNPLLWKNNTLKKDVYDALVRIAHDWAEFSRIPFKNIKDIVLTGGNCNFNYTAFSDIDVHLVVDMKGIIKDPDILDDWLYDKKVLWANYHPNIRVKGYPVELYAEDSMQKPVKGQGVYSLMKDSWISEPEHQGIGDIFSDKNLIRKIKYFAKQIDSFTNQYAYATKSTINQARNLKARLHRMRASGIQKSGEFAHESLVYKSLRNLGKMDQLNDFLKHAADREYSID